MAFVTRIIIVFLKKLTLHYEMDLSPVFVAAIL